ncbi:hypothetical protein [Tropicibacter oceani]|uniref:GlsB/YeaQ/YmgE family stress response membrane protein n=1 Tax=Tropicibacter oceani TaxID=3058420 RepID=A0ABY8QG86_9RHOB|nr:hypothetical protein [Tropicibacter oceani]WGW03637.1 hypothetical protein QF118_17220 [Tropicibacter oceani]
MISTLDLLGTIGASVLGLPGILGVALGMMTRNWILAAALGGAVGLIAPILMGGSHSTHVAITPMEYVISIVVGILAGLVGSAIRHKGATV